MVQESYKNERDSLNTKQIVRGVIIENGAVVFTAILSGVWIESLIDCFIYYHRRNLGGGQSRSPYFWTLLSFDNIGHTANLVRTEK